MFGVIIGALIATESQRKISELDRYHQLRIAALDKRLQAHQEAFARWRNIVRSSTNGANINELVKESEQWWEKNCLYLDPEASNAFQLSFYAALDRKNILRSGSKKDKIDNWNTIMNAGNLLVTTISLPSIGEITRIDNKDVSKENA